MNQGIHGTSFTPVRKRPGDQWTKDEDMGVQGFLEAEIHIDNQYDPT